MQQLGSNGWQSLNLREIIEALLYPYSWSKTSMSDSGYWRSSLQTMADSFHVRHKGYKHRAGTYTYHFKTKWTVLLMRINPKGKNVMVCSLRGATSTSQHVIDTSHVTKSKRRQNHQTRSLTPYNSEPRNALERVKVNIQPDYSFTFFQY